MNEFHRKMVSRSSFPRLDVTYAFHVRLRPYACIGYCRERKNTKTNNTTMCEFGGIVLYIYPIYKFNVLCKCHWRYSVLYVANAAAVLNAHSVAQAARQVNERQRK